MSNKTHILNLLNRLITKILNFKLVIVLEYQNIKIFLQKVTLQICLKKFLGLKKLKIMWRGHMLSLIFIEKKLFERFPKTNCQKQIKNNLKLKTQ